MCMVPLEISSLLASVPDPIVAKECLGNARPWLGTMNATDVLILDF